MSIDKKYYHNLDLVGNELKNARIYNLTTTQRLALGLTALQKGFIVYDITLLALYVWNGSAWTTTGGGGIGTVTSVSAGTGMSFTTITGAGSVDIDTTKVPYIAAGFSGGFLKWNASTSTWIFDSNSYVPVGRNITINGVTQDLSTDRTWTIASGGLTQATASGTDTYTVTIPSVTAYTDGDAYLIRFTNGNTTAATLAINTLPAVPLYRNNDGPVIGGDILSGAEMLLVYNSTLSAFQCIGIAPNTLITYVTNAEATTITKGQVVYAFGGTGDRMTVKLANNTTDATSAQTVGLVLSASIGANQKGFIIVEGLLSGLSTLPSSTWNDGDPVYLGSTPGSVTKTKPHAPNHLVYLGVVTTASPGSAGRMYVRVQNGYELDELHNVQAQTPSVNDVLYYFGGGQWKTSSIPGVLGYTPENVSNKSTNTSLGTSDTLYPSQNAVKVYADNLLGNSNALVYKGVIDCSTNPNYPAANAGELYIASVAGKIGGVSGIDVEVGDMIICNTDNTISGNQATVGIYWNIIQKNIVGAVTGPATSVNNNVVFFDGATGKLIKDSGLTLSGTNTGDETNATIKTKLGAANTTLDGYLTSTDWNTFNNKAAKTQVDYIGGIIQSPANQSYTLVLTIPFNGTIVETSTRSTSGTCTATWFVNATPLTNTNAVSSSLNTQVQSQAFVAGDTISVTISANAACVDMNFNIKYNITLL